MNTTSWAFMSWIDIPDRNDPSKTYLRRLRIVRTPWFALYLHKIFLADTDRDLHSHPWTKFYSLILRGGYTEEVTLVPPSLGKPLVIENRTHKRFSVHGMPIHRFHRITRVSPRLVTLVAIGREKIEWGFWTPEGFIPHTEYNRGDLDVFA